MGGMARHNAFLYGTHHHIEFFLGDFFELHQLFLVDVVFLSPPWGGPKYSAKTYFDLNTDIASVCNGKGLREIIRAANNLLRVPLGIMKLLKFKIAVITALRLV